MRHADLLAEVPLFDGLSSEDCEALADRLAEKSYVAQQTVFAKGDRGSSMYLVLSGAVEIFLPAATDAPRVVLKEVRTGEYFGELALFDDKPRSASAEASVDTVLLELTREEFSAHLIGSKAAALAILSEMAHRLRDTNAMIGQRAATNVMKEIEENLTWVQRLSDKVAEWNGSWTFIVFITTLTAGWTIVNRYIWPFDQYPYIFYNLLLTILVALQGPLIVMSQNREAAKDRAEAEADFRVNLKNEVGIETFARELGAFQVEAAKRLDALERGTRRT